MRYVYTAGPMTGLTHEEADSWRSNELLHDILGKNGWEILSPTDAKEKPWLIEKYSGDNVMPARVPHVMERREVQLDLEHIHAASAIIANLKDAKIVSIGTVCEIAYAYAIGRPIIVVDDDGSLHDHMFIRQMATVTVADMGAAVDELLKIGKRLVEPAYA